MWCYRFKIKQQLTIPNKDKGLRDFVRRFHVHTQINQAQHAFPVETLSEDAGHLGGVHVLKPFTELIVLMLIRWPFHKAKKKAKMNNEYT